MHMHMEARVLLCRCLARKHRHSNNGAAAAVSKDSKYTSNSVAGRSASLTREEPHSTTPHFPRRLQGIGDARAIVIGNIRKKRDGCPRFERSVIQMLRRLLAGFRFRR